MEFYCRSFNGNCEYSLACSYTDCGDLDDDECSECSLVDYTDNLQQNHNTQCRPYITNQCIGNIDDGLFKMNTCSGGVLTKGVYDTAECKTLLNFDQFGGDYKCKDEYMDDNSYTYYEIDCNPNVIEPKCNFAVVGDQYYPIGACESETEVNNTSGDIISFEYVCNDDYEIELKVYSTFNCDGNPDLTINNTEFDLKDFQCRSKYGNCLYSIKCSFSNCGDDSGCDLCSGLNIETLIQTHNTHCIPYITNECFGNDALLQSYTCSNGQLSEGFYFGSSCSIDNYGMGNTFNGDNSACKNGNDDDDGDYTYYMIECHVTGIYLSHFILLFITI